tara:strand:+ start:327 stop:485 length:159 start_codon:yes stop_codon:yes gene_type:complete
MLKKLISLLEKIKCRLSCCYQSQCSLNDENKIDEDSIEDEDDEEFVDERAAF